MRTKISKGKTRSIEIYNLDDRVISELFSMTLEAIYSPCFEPESFGYQKDKSSIQAVNKLLQLSEEIDDGWMIQCDIYQFFASINIDRLMNILSYKIKDREFLDCLRQILEHRYKRVEGLNLGSGLACNLANIFLDHIIDKSLKAYRSINQSARIEFMRYGDDFIVIANCKEAATELFSAIEQWLHDFKLETNYNKFSKVPFGFMSSHMRTFGPAKPFHFLGFVFYWEKHCPSESFMLKTMTPQNSIQNKQKEIRKKLRKALQKKTNLRIALTDSIKIVEGFIDHYEPFESVMANLTSFRSKAYQDIVEIARSEYGFSRSEIDKILSEEGFPSRTLEAFSVPTYS